MPSAEYQREWRAKRLESYRAYNRKPEIVEKRRLWRVRNGKHREYKLKKYGLTKDQFSLLLTKQGNRCAICAREFVLEWRRGERLYPRVDHDHATGKVRGLLCHDCNVSLGLIGESLERIRGMELYLINHSGTEGSRDSSLPSEK